MGLGLEQSDCMDSSEAMEVNVPLPFCYIIRNSFSDHLQSLSYNFKPSFSVPGVKVALAWAQKRGWTGGQSCARRGGTG